jgi:hypothetical protein
MAFATAGYSSFRLSATSQQYFFLEQTSHQQSASSIFSQNKSAPVISHRPNEQAVVSFPRDVSNARSQLVCFFSFSIFSIPKNIT